MKGSGFVFDYVHLLYYKCHKVYLNHGGSYIDSPDWIKNKKAKLNPVNKKINKCFQYRNWTRTQNHLVRKRTLNHLAKLAKCLSCVVSTYLYGTFDCMFLSCHERISE